jgi:hypothetical protein
VNSISLHPAGILTVVPSIAPSSLRTMICLPSAESVAESISERKLKFPSRWSDKATILRPSRNEIQQPHLRPNWATRDDPASGSPQQHGQQHHQEHHCADAKSDRCHAFFVTFSMTSGADTEESLCSVSLRGGLATG